MARKASPSSTASHALAQTKDADRGWTLGVLSARLTALAERERIDVAEPDALAWAIVGALSMELVRWAVYEEIDDAALAGALHPTARAMLSARRRRRR